MSNMVTVGARTRTLTKGFTRPNDTIAYTAGDAVSNSDSAPTILQFELGEGKASGKISDALAMSSVNAGTKPDLELWLFDSVVAAGSFVDNAACAVTDAELLTAVARINFPVASWIGVGANAACHVTPGHRFNSLQVSVLYGVVVVRNAYTPAANEVFTFRLKVELDGDAK